jgi:hypothetical protein
MLIIAKLAFNIMESIKKYTVAVLVRALKVKQIRYI